MQAVAEERLDLVGLLLTAGAEVDAQLSEEQQRVTPLYLAAERKNLEVAQLLLDRGADPNGASPKGTPLSRAACAGSEEVVRALLAAGGRVDATDDQGLQPIHMAAALGKTGVLCALLAAGASGLAATENEDHWTPLHLAALGG